MAVLTAVITHLEASEANRQLAYLRALAPGARFVVCYGGSREEFERLDGEDAVFVDDPLLRGPNREQSYNQVLAAIYDGYVRDDETVGLVYLVEHDQLILSEDFEDRLTEMAGRSPAGLFAKHASPRTDTNCPHYVRYRDDERLARFIAGISRRENQRELWGCLGTGMLFRREALREFCSVIEAPHAYLEIFIPTVIHHLGFGVENVDAMGDLYACVRWRPLFSVEEAAAVQRAGRSFVHPFKELDALDRFLAPTRSPAGLG